MYQSAKQACLVRAAAAAATCQLASFYGKSKKVGCNELRPSFSPGFAGADLPSGYKTHFTQAYDAQAAKGGQAANIAKRDGHQAGDIEMRTTIARMLMERLGYTAEDLDIIGKDDVLKMQGVGSPFTLARIESGNSVLDLGSGFGVDAFLAAEKVGPSGHVVGIDLSEEEVKKASTRAEERNLNGRCKFLKADMEHLPFEDNSFDIVISNGGFCLVPDKKSAFKEILRVLKPGGRFAVACTVLRGELPPLQAPKRWPPCMDVFLQHADALQLVESCGFRDVVVDDTNSAMDVWNLLGETDVKDISQLLNPPIADNNGGGQMCSHARKAAERRAKERIDEFLTRDREAGVHWGNPEFDHIYEFDMNRLCARIIIAARKPARD